MESANQVSAEEWNAARRRAVRRVRASIGPYARECVTGAQGQKDVHHHQVHRGVAGVHVAPVDHAGDAPPIIHQQVARVQVAVHHRRHGRRAREVALEQPQPGRWIIDQPALAQVH